MLLSWKSRYTFDFWYLTRIEYAKRYTAERCPDIKGQNEFSRASLKGRSGEHGDERVAQCSLHAGPSTGRQSRRALVRWGLLSLRRRH